MTEEVSFNNLPEAVSSIMADMKELKNICLTIMDGKSNEVWLTVKDLIEYLPEHPSEQTIYRWKGEGTIPFTKNERTRALRFNKDEIDEWIKNGRRMTIFEQAEIHDTEIIAQREAKKGEAND